MSSSACGAGSAISCPGSSLGEPSSRSANCRGCPAVWLARMNDSPKTESAITHPAATTAPSAREGTPAQRTPESPGVSSIAVATTRR